MVALVGCSSSPKTVAVEDRLSDRQGAMEKSDEFLTDAQGELNNMSKKISDMKKDSQGKAGLPNKARFESSLDHLLLAVQRSQLDLRELQARNTERRRQFESRVNRAMEPVAQPVVGDDDVYQAD